MSYIIINLLPVLMLLFLNLSISANNNEIIQTARE